MLLKVIFVFQLKLNTENVLFRHVQYLDSELLRNNQHEVNVT